MQSESQQTGSNGKTEASVNSNSNSNNNISKNVVSINVDEISEMQGLVQQIISVTETKLRYKNPYDAYTDVIVLGLSKALLKDYEPHEKLANLIRKLFTCNGAKFAAMLVPAAGISIATGIFYWDSAIEAVGVVAKILHFKNTWFESFLSWFAPIMGSGENVALTAFSIKDMISKFTRTVSPPEMYLLGWKNVTTAHTARVRGKKVVDLMLSASPVIATYAITVATGANPWISAVSAVANYAPNWMALSNLDYIPKSLTPNDEARLGLANYLNDICVELFNYDKHTVVYPKIKDIAAKLKTIKDPIELANLTLLELFNFVNIPSNNNAEDKKQTFDNKPYILPKESKTLKREICEASVKWIGTIGASGYVVAAGDGASIFWKQNPNVPGIPVAISAILPYFGLSYISSREIGKNIFSGKKNLADIALDTKVAEKIKSGIYYLLGGFGVGSGFTNFIANYKYLRLKELPQELQERIALFMGGLGLLSASMANTYFTLRLLDDLLIIYKEKFGSEELRTLIDFALEIRKLQRLFLEMTPDNFAFIMHEINQNGREAKKRFDSAFESTDPDSNAFVKYEKDEKIHSSDVFEKLEIQKNAVVTFLINQCQDNKDSCEMLGLDLFDVVTSKSEYLLNGEINNALQNYNAQKGVLKKLFEEGGGSISSEESMDSVIERARHKAKLAGKLTELQHLNNLLEKLNKTEGKLRELCAAQKSILAYLTECYDKPYEKLGWRSLMLYASSNNINLYVWENDSKTEKRLNLVVKTFHEENTKTLNLLLDMPAGDYSVLIEFNQDKLITLQLANHMRAILQDRMDPKSYKVFLDQLDYLNPSNTSYNYLTTYQAKSKPVHMQNLRLRHNANMTNGDEDRVVATEKTRLIKS